MAISAKDMVEKLKEEAKKTKRTPTLPKVVTEFLDEVWPLYRDDPAVYTKALVARFLIERFPDTVSGVSDTIAKKVGRYFEQKARENNA